MSKSFFQVSIVLFVFQLPILNFSSTHINEWEKVGLIDNILIYSKMSNTTQLKQIKLVGYIHANQNAIITALNDVPQYPKWVSNCSKAFAFDQLSEHEYYYYVKTDLPFPLDDRDLVVHTNQWFGTENTWHSKSTAMPLLLRENDGVVRIKTYNSHWKITPVSEKSTKFTYTIALNPGGEIPLWLMDKLRANAAISTIKSLEKRSIELMKLSHND